MAVQQGKRQSVQQMLLGQQGVHTLQKNELRPLSHTIQINELKIVDTSKRRN